MSVYLRYSFAKGYSPKKVPECDRAARSFQKMLVVAARHYNILLAPIVWVLSRFYRRTLTAEHVEYEFYLIPSPSPDAR